jgi:hypothetical protein
MDVLGGIAATKTAMDIAKTLKDINKSFDEATYKANMTELIENLSEARLALVEAKEQIFNKDREIEALKELNVERKNLVKGEGGYSYLTNDEGRPIGFPVCPKCDAVDGRLIQLVEHLKGNVGKCPACANEYKPVTCFLPTGGTLWEQQIAQSKRRSEEMSRRMAEMQQAKSYL